MTGISWRRRGGWRRVRPCRLCRWCQSSLLGVGEGVIVRVMMCYCGGFYGERWVGGWVEKVGMRGCIDKMY